MTHRAFPVARMSAAAFCALALIPPSPGSASVGLANPAAEHCVAEGGLYGLRDIEGGQQGICQLPDGQEVDAWTFYRDSLREETEAPNPAASHCVGQGGTYDLETSDCTLSDGRVVGGWDLLKESHEAEVSLANPAATYCLDQGGAYEIRDGASGQVGICKLQDGTETDAWSFYRKNN
ncbi:MAG: DUF333 domain-containing protein [Rhodobacteraceae bacterium]|nr:DUF333 domain-containing protein [Paracoccaceae bacterium]